MRSKTAGMKRIVMFLCILFAASAGMAQENAASPKETELTNDLKQGQVVYLCFYNNKTDPDGAAMKSTVDPLTGNFQGAVTAVYVADNDKVEEKLRMDFKVFHGDTAVFIVTPDGRVVAKLEGVNITRANLMRALYTSCGGGSCGSGCK